MTKRSICRTLPVLLLAGFIFMSFAGQAGAKDFYEGKTIRILVCCSPGGFYDRWARLFARHMGQYIPGKPTSSSRTCPGRAHSSPPITPTTSPSRTARPSLCRWPDCTWTQVVGRKEVRFDIAKFQWIGTQEVSHSVLFCRSDSKYQSVDDLIKNKKDPARLGSSGTAGNSYLMGKILEKGVGANFNFVMGYPGGSEIDLAVERGEVLCRGMTIPPHFGREPYLTWHKNKFVKQLAQSGEERDPRLKDVPTSLSCSTSTMPRSWSGPCPR